jgi:hypothetical protein
LRPRGRGLEVVNGEGDAVRPIAIVGVLEAAYRNCRWHDAFRAEGVRPVDVEKGGVRVRREDGVDGVPASVQVDPCPMRYA